MAACGPAHLGRTVALTRQLAKVRHKARVISQPPPLRHNSSAFLPAPRRGCRCAPPLSLGRRLIAAFAARRSQNRRVICSVANAARYRQSWRRVNWFVNSVGHRKRRGEGWTAKPALRIHRAVVIHLARSALRPPCSCSPMKTSVQF